MLQKCISIENELWQRWNNKGFYSIAFWGNSLHYLFKSGIKHVFQLSDLNLCPKIYTYTKMGYNWLILRMMNTFRTEKINRSHTPLILPDNTWCFPRRESGTQIRLIWWNSVVFIVEKTGRSEAMVLFDLKLEIHGAILNCLPRLMYWFSGPALSHVAYSTCVFHFC